MYFPAKVGDENSYRNLDFTPATEIVKRQKDFKIKESQVQSKLSDNPRMDYLRARVSLLGYSKLLTTIVSNGA